MSEFSSKELLALSRKEKNAQKRIRLLAVSYILEGKSRYKAAEILNVSRRSVNEWASHYFKFGLAGLDAKKQTGRPAYISNLEKQQLINFIHNKSQSTDGGRLTGQDIVTYIKKEFGVQYQLNSVYNLLKSLGFSWITSRSKHPKQDEQVQEDFKKNSGQ